MFYEHQRKIIELNQKRWGLFLDVGTGKTLTAIKLAEKNKANFLVVTMKSLKENWRREIVKWLDDKTIQYQIVSKEEYRRDHDSLPRYDAVIYDEFHFFGNYKSQLHKAALAYHRKHNPTYIWGLTATPIMSSVMSVWSLARLLGNNINFRTFQYKFFTQVKMGSKFIPVQKKNIEHEIADILRSFGSVVSKEEALDLPEAVHTFEYFELTKEQKQAIKDLDNDPTTVMPIVYNTKEIQITGGVTKDGTEITCEKLPRLLELIQQYPKTCIVAKHKAELRMLHKYIPNSAIMDGETPENDRQVMIDKADRGEVTLLLQADMGVGFNLTGVSLMIFYSHTYNFITYSQVLGRIHRIGQKNKCTYIHFINRDTIDEAVWECLENKRGFDIALYVRKKPLSKTKPNS